MGSNFEGLMVDVVLREYRPGDWVAMYALDVECFQPAFRFSRRAMHTFAEAPGAIIVLAEANDVLAGFCIVQIENQIGYVVTLDVATAWRRDGLAHRLMAGIETRVQTAGIMAMALHVHTRNTAAVRFYEGIGYTRTGRAEGFYGRGLDAFMYVKNF